MNKSLYENKGNAVKFYYRGIIDYYENSKRINYIY